jgi:hypothetical protein
MNGGGAQHNPLARDTMASPPLPAAARVKRCLEALGCTDTHEKPSEIGPGRMTFRLNQVDAKQATETALACGARRAVEWLPGVLMVALV